MLKVVDPRPPISELSDRELHEIVEDSPDAVLRGAARAQLELRSYQRGRRVADRQQRIVWLAVVAAWASAVAAVAAAFVAWSRL